MIRQTIPLILTLVLSLAVPRTQAQHLGQQVDRLISQLTLDEKLSLMEHHNPAIPRLDLPAYSWWNEALHGVARNGSATVWPMPIALAASFNPYLVHNIFSLVALEAHLKRFSAPDSILLSPTDYSGLTFFTPNINIFRDPRWGRGMETYGEDPYLSAVMGLMCVEGLQHSSAFNVPRSQLTAAACLKHLAVHSGPESLRHQFDAIVSPYQLHSTYLPAFEYIIKKTDIQQVMCAYNRLNGSPCCTNRHLLVDLLRNKWHYDNLLVTDCWALNDCWELDSVVPRHQTHSTATMAADDAFSNEVDLECGSGLIALRNAVDSGYIAPSAIDLHVRRILNTRLNIARIGNPLPLLNHTYIQSSVSPESAALQSFVLLKNASVSDAAPLLPLTNSTRILLRGPNAYDSLMPLGNYNGTPFHTVTIAEGIGNHPSFILDSVCYDVIIYAGGLSPQLEGEELQVEQDGFFKGDRTCIELPRQQINEIHQLRTLDRPIILLLCTGSPIGLDEIIDEVDAVLVCWYGGEAMGTAIAQSLSGIHNRFGRLPVTFYRSSSQLPPFERYDMTGRTYRYLSEKPLYPFGYGLNYNSVRYDSLSYDSDSHTLSGIVSAYNYTSSDHSANEVVQIYWQHPDESPEGNLSLIGIVPLLIQDDKPSYWSYTLDPFWLRNFDESLSSMVPIPSNSSITLLVGSSSDRASLTPITIKY